MVACRCCNRTYERRTQFEQLPTAAAFLPSNECDMLEIMYVRCAHCGYDNSPEYRFCGMCGASLAHPAVAPKAVPPESPVPAQGGNGGNEHTETVHGPSFLGLAEDPKVEFHYLYEDEEPKSHLGLVLFLLLLIGGGGFLAWQWRNNGYPFNRLSAASSASPSP